MASIAFFPPISKSYPVVQNQESTTALLTLDQGRGMQQLHTCPVCLQHYMSTTMHKIHLDRNVRIAGSDRVYFYTINLGQKCESHRCMNFALHCSSVHQISIQWALLDLSLDNKVTACLSLVLVLRISGFENARPKCVIYIPLTWMKQAAPVSALHIHCVISQKPAICIHQHHCENPRSHYCTFFIHVFMPTLFGTLGRDILFSYYRSMFNVSEQLIVSIRQNRYQILNKQSVAM